MRSSGVVIAELLEAPADRAGGKARGLARLMEAGLPVPPAVVVPIGESVAQDDLTQVVDRLGEPLAVRSSATGEDAGERSAAGQFDTVLDVTRDGLAAAVARVRRSATSARAASYGVDAEMAVVIQRQVLATRAGVAFSRDPVTREDEIVIEAVFGLGDALVSGNAAPDRYRVALDGRVRARIARKDGPKALLRALRDDEARELAHHVRRAERVFAAPVDVEFCFEGASLWVVQCRPITTL